MPDFSPYAPSISAMDSRENSLSISAIPDRTAEFDTPVCRCCGSGCTRSWPVTRMPMMPIGYATILPSNCSPINPSASL